MSNVFGQIIIKLSRSKIDNQRQYLRLKERAAGAFKLAPPANALLLKAYRDLLKKKRIKADKTLEKFLIKRPTRSISGVAVITVLTKPYTCPGQCIYCPAAKGMPKSYLPDEPAVMRAIRCHFDPALQVNSRIKALRANGHDTSKIELIVIGGTWSYLPKKYQIWFIKRCFDSANGRKAKNLAQAQKINEKAKHRIIGLTLETRPDFITPEEIKQMRELGATKVEIGVQNTDDKILKLVKRGHTNQETIEATKLLKDAGFKISYHLMTNLPTATPAKDLKMMEKIFKDENYKPDLIKIYPTSVIANTILYQWWKKKKYQSYTKKQLVDLLIKIKKIVPYWIRISRLIRDIPGGNIISGNKETNLRQVIQKMMAEKNEFCKCIRCREARQQKVDLKNTKLFIEKYRASNGDEYFITFESKDRKILYAFLRLRIPVDLNKNHYLKELRNAALIRELHTYGELIPIGQTKKGASQHIGFGKRLMGEAEKICRQQKIKKIAVISGIGVREYYRQLGYKLKESYLIKNLK